MKVLSLFDGISCALVALKRIGINPEKYYASEVDKWAIQVAKKNHPEIIHVGDVTQLKGDDFKDIDLLIGGSPCQGFSFSGKQLNFKDSRSKLFFEFVRLLKELKPKYFLLENVRMKKEYIHIINEHLEVEPVEINSALVSAQNRRRLYWTNIPCVNQPQDKNIVLKDILEENPECPVIMSDTTIERFKGYGVPLMDGSEKKARCLSAMEYIKNGKQGNYLKFVAGLEKGRRLNDGKNLSRNFREGGYSGLYGDIEDGVIKYRKLTPVECERLQTLPDNYTKGVSNTQRYKALGNGFTVDVIAHILKNMDAS